jgi:hypothetical protein
MLDADGITGDVDFDCAEECDQDMRCQSRGLGVGGVVNQPWLFTAATRFVRRLPNCRLYSSRRRVLP